MFSTVKASVDILQVVADLTDMEVIPAGDQNFQLEDKSCPYCGHFDCFKIKSDEDAPENSFAHCFSCGFHGDVVQIWSSLDPDTHTALPQSAWKPQGKACRELAREYEVDIKSDYSPIQEIFDIAARYYHSLLMGGDQSPEVILRDLSPFDYQQTVRFHSEQLLERMQIGWSDGLLHEFFESLGYEKELLISSGLFTERRGKLVDYLPAKVFIYPHLIDGRVSHFTFKDPTHRVSYQLKQEYRLNGWAWYGQDSVEKYDTIIMVEGENDLLSVMDAVNRGGLKYGVLGAIGQLSKSQVEWAAQHLHGKRVISIFDLDAAGDKYRDTLALGIQKDVAYLSNLVLPNIEEGEGPRTRKLKDIDEFLCKGHDLELLLEEADKFQVTRHSLIEILDRKKRGKSEGDSARTEESAGEDTDQEQAKRMREHAENSEDGEGDDSGTLYEKNGCYYKIKYRDNKPYEHKLSNFLIDLRYIYIREDQRHREVVIRKFSGEKSLPIMVSSETKVSIKAFRALIANAVDASFYGNDSDLTDLWEFLFSKAAPKIVNLPETVGSIPDSLGGGWLFADRYIDKSGKVYLPDQNGVFWVNGMSGIRPVSIDQASAMNTVDVRRIPSLTGGLDLDLGDYKQLEQQFLTQLAKNVGNLGLAALMMGWTKACSMSEEIFKVRGFFPFMFVFGKHGKGKTEILKWLLGIYNMQDKSLIVRSQYKNGVGFARLINYYSSLPAVVDEIRAEKEDDDTSGTFRGWYNREGRVMGTQDGNRVRTQSVRSCMAFGGEDLFLDPALRERCVQINIKNHNRELVESYAWIKSREEFLPLIGFGWIVEACRADFDKLHSDIGVMNKTLLAEGVSPRMAFNYAIVSIFAKQILEENHADFDWDRFVCNYARADFEDQKEQSTLNLFLERVEGIQAEERSALTPEHVKVEGNMLYLWFSEIFQVVKNKDHKTEFSRQALLRHIREEPYFVEEAREKMGLQETRRRVIVVNVDHPNCPEALQNIATKAGGTSGLE